MVTKQQIEQFLAAEPVAIAGVSRNPKKFGYTAFREVRTKGMNAIPINPNLSEIDGVTCYKSVAELPAGINALWVLTRKENTAEVVREALEKGIKNIWIQQMSETPEALSLANGKDVNLISKQCLLMYFHPHGLHKFHGSLKRFFGGMPK